MTLPLPNFTVLTFDVQKLGAKEAIRPFLQGQLTCDMSEISPTQSRLFAHCNLKGRMVTLGRVLERKDGQLLLIIPNSLTQIAIRHLDQYAGFSRLKARVDDTFSVFGLCPESPNAFPARVDQVSHVDGISWICVQESPLRLLGVAQESSTPMEFQQRADDEWLCQEIENRTPFLTPETSGKFLPHEIDLPQKHGVSFNKGCFLGQEIIARMEHLGKLKTKMVMECVAPDAPSDGEVICEAIHPETQRKYRLVLQS